MSTSEEFLESVFLSNTLRDAFATRARIGGRRIYRDKKPTDGARTVVGNALKSKLRSLAWQYYSRKVDDVTHIRNIAALARFVSTTSGVFLNGGTLFFGVAQKALNLYLKCLWCWDPNFIPPHCPFDDKIIKSLKALPVGVDTKMDNLQQRSELSCVACGCENDGRESIAGGLGSRGLVLVTQLSMVC
jgi:hypothetical protein